MDRERQANAVEKLDRSILLAEKASTAIANGAPLDGPEVKRLKEAISEVNDALRPLHDELLVERQARIAAEAAPVEQVRSYEKEWNVPRFFKSALFPLILIVMLVFIVSTILRAAS